MRSSARHHGPTWLALAIVVLACSGRDTSVSCSPTLTCSLDEERFAPPEPVDAGTPACGSNGKRCEATVLTLGGAHGCAIALGGELLCWGDDSEGQLGGGTGRVLFSDEGLDESDTDIEPVREGVADVAAGQRHTCAVLANGDVACWGRNVEGQVDGVGSDEPVTEPLRVGVDEASQISAGATHSCALVEPGVVCWGSARYGQVGREVSDAVLAPGLVEGTAGAVEVSAGLRHTCARFEDGRVTCWGELLEDDATWVSTEQPRQVADLDDATAISAGAGFTCALRPQGRIACWGDNGSGQLGNGTTEPSASAVQVVDAEPSLQVRAGGMELDGELLGHACALTKGFFVQCWGRNVEGQLGVGEAGDNPRPQIVLGEAGEEDDEPLLPDVAAIGAGAAFSCSVDHDGPVLCWGDNERGQLGLVENVDGRRHTLTGRGARAVGRPTQVYLLAD